MPNWTRIRAFYEECRSPKRTAIEYDVPVDTIKSRIKREGWGGGVQSEVQDAPAHPDDAPSGEGAESADPMRMLRGSPQSAAPVGRSMRHTRKTDPDDDIDASAEEYSAVVDAVASEWRGPRPAHRPVDLL